MGTLVFECPATGTQVSTGIEVDPGSFKSLSPQTTYLHCPHCPTPHLLGVVRAWLSNVEKPPEPPPMHFVAGRPT
jgi:hypothetical protein